MIVYVYIQIHIHACIYLQLILITRGAGVSMVAVSAEPRMHQEKLITGQQDTLASHFGGESSFSRTVAAAGTVATFGPESFESCKSQQP